jgi:hypothetical protein
MPFKLGTNQIVVGFGVHSAVENFAHGQMEGHGDKGNFQGIPKHIGQQFEPRQPSDWQTKKVDKNYLCEFFG